MEDNHKEATEALLKAGNDVFSFPLICATMGWETVAGALYYFNDDNSLFQLILKLAVARSESEKEEAQKKIIDFYGGEEKFLEYRRLQMEHVLPDMTKK